MKGSFDFSNGELFLQHRNANGGYSALDRLRCSASWRFVHCYIHSRSCDDLVQEAAFKDRVQTGLLPSFVCTCVFNIHDARLLCRPVFQSLQHSGFYGHGFSYADQIHVQHVAHPSFVLLRSLLQRPQEARAIVRVEFPVGSTARVVRLFNNKHSYWLPFHRKWIYRTSYSRWLAACNDFRRGGGDIRGPSPKTFNAGPTLGGELVQQDGAPRDVTTYCIPCRNNVFTDTTGSDRPLYQSRTKS